MPVLTPVTGGSMAGLWKTPRKWSSPTSAVVPRRPIPVSADTTRPTGRPATVGTVPGRLVTF